MLASTPVSVPHVSTIVRPSGRLPARVYWTRRGLLLVLVLLLAWGLARCSSVDPSAESGSSAVGDTISAADAPGADAAVGSPLGLAGGAAADASTAAAGAGATAGTATPRPRDGRRSRSSAPPQRVRPVLGAPVGACDPAATTVIPSVGGEVIAGAGAQLQLRLSTVGAQACRLSLGNRLLVQVARDDEPVWRLADCPSALTADTVVLHPDWATVVDIAWSGRTSNATCSVETTAVRPGTYQLQASMLAGEPGTVDLEVAEARDPAGKGR